MGGGKQHTRATERSASGSAPTAVDLDPIISQLHPLERKAVPHLKSGMLASEIAAVAGMQEVEVARALQWLENKAILAALPVNETIVGIGENGKKAIAHGMPEMRFLAAAQEGHVARDAIIKAAHLDTQEYGVSVGVLKKHGLIEMDKDGHLALTAKGKKANTESPEIAILKRIGEGIALNTLSGTEQKAVAELKGRKDYVVLRERKDQRIALTPLGTALAQTNLSAYAFADALTREDLETGAWKGKTYRSFDVAAPVPAAHGGREHFTEEALEYARHVWTDMGFREMEGPIVNTAFWDLDALFVPQDHPAREMQDTFYLAHPQRATVDRTVFERVKEIHETGGRTGSKGWRTAFDRAVSERLLLRTHTTVLSALALQRIRDGKLPMPGKYFAIGKCFRNEAVDWKHLFEFNQVEGIVVDPDANFSQLLGYLKAFFAKMGYPDIRLRPSHFPYTEPSVEIDIFHTGKNEWVEFGGAGVFRPEVTKALLGEDVPVLAWGPGFDRIIVEHFGITDLRDLYRNDIAQLRGAKRFLRLEGAR